MRALRTFLATWGVLLSTQLAHASNYACSGQIQYLGLSADGGLHVDNGHGVWRVCEVNANTQVQAAACKGWYSLMTVAQTRKSIVGIYFSDGRTCAQLGSWVALTPYFVDSREQ